MAGKWLETIAQTPLDLTVEERNLLDMVRSMLAETEFSLDGTPQTQTTSPYQQPDSPVLPIEIPTEVPMEVDTNIDASLVEVTPIKLDGRITRSKTSHDSSSSSPTAVTTSTRASETNEATTTDPNSRAPDADAEILHHIEEKIEPPKVLSEEEQRKNIKKLGVAVVRLWAETFKGTHIFAIVKVIGASLEVYAELLDRDCDL